MTKKKKMGLKELNKDFEISIPLMAQVLFTEAVLIFAIVSLFEVHFLPIFYIIIGITLLIMAYNNYFYFKKKYFNGFCVILSGVYIILAIYFIISTLIGLMR